MALAPRFAGQKFAAAGVPNLHTVEIYLDYVCPYSAIMYNTVYNSVFPLVSEKYASKVQIIFRQHIQPWHPSSTLVHEAGVAVLKVQPSKFFEFSKALFDDSKSFYDVGVVNEIRNETYKRLARIAGSVGIDEKKILELLWVDDKPAADGSLNIGNKVTDDLKILIKTGRLVGIHVTPTVVFNGVVESGIESSFSAEQWAAWLEKNVG